MKKMSYVNALELVLNGEEINDEARERLVALRDSLVKRNSSKSGKPTKAQIANAEIGNDILNMLENGKAYSIAEIKELVPALRDATPQKIAPICNKLVENHQLVKSTVKGRAYYTIG